MDNDINKLLYWRLEIEKELSKIDLTIKPHINIINLTYQTLKFVGVAINHDKIKLRQNIATNFKKKARQTNIASIPSYFGWCKYTNSDKLFIKYIGNSEWWKQELRKRHEKSL